MRKTVHKWFWVWDFDEEEKWLNEMAAKGLALVGVGWCRYEFEDCLPGEYAVCLEFFENRCNTVENTKYIEFLEETGIEHVGKLLRWHYFRKKTQEKNFRLYSDNVSRVKHLTMIIRFIAVLTGVNLYMGIYDIFVYFMFHNSILLLGVVNLLCGTLCGYGIVRLIQKRKRLETEQQIFE